MSSISSSESSVPHDRKRLTSSIKQSLRVLSIQLSLLNHQVSERLGLNDVDLDCLDLVSRFGPLSPSALAQRASLICVGHGEGISLKISPDIIAPERSIVGSEYFRYNEMPTNLQRLREHRAYLTQIITHRMGVDQIQQAFESFFFGCETGKVIIEQ